MMRLLVIGASGQVARALAAQARMHPGLGLTTAGRPDLDLSVPGSARNVILRDRPEVVINAAAWTAVDRAESEPEAASRVNAEAVGEIAGACADLGARFVHLSTDYVFDGTARRPWREDDPTGPLGVYGRTKLAGEQLALAAQADTVILRTAWVYGPNPPNFLCTMLRLARTRTEVQVVDDQTGCPTAAAEVARACLAAAVPGGPGGIFHIVQPDPVSWAGFAREIFAASARLGGPSAQVRPISTDAYPTPAQRPAYSALDTSRLSAAFGFVPRDRKDSLETCMAELAAAGWDVG
jgi:dTDP-4-dehydrorhamnose reductase